MTEAETSAGLSKAEREAVKDRAKELRDQAKAGKNRAAGEKAVQAVIEEMPAGDAEIARRVHEIVADAAPELMPKTWYGQPAYANKDGKVIAFFQGAAKFGTRYATLGFNEDANLDDGEMWATAFAVTKLTPAVEQRIRDLVLRSIR
ncbi:hypothetical protein NQ152_10355 [Microbacterium sp. zg.B48]|uniref:iron chaperone n=1 Tax=unclassified Microbacterium TaxID=2609290 RepID=UPI00214B88C2|nr:MULTISPECIES: hypothetical protein [unclassified Microbacterium]MCR2763904.1 hypothetical protein [Microbacterium sp. zg.B48]MCR2810326.1 hypothetical protein [Microbacterium sp. zg.B185]WIM18385.1 hypothetical protein QNO12_12365 [Microbacterium sp. zg-B185]